MRTGPFDNIILSSRRLPEPFRKPAHIILKLNHVSPNPIPDAVPPRRNQAGPQEPPGAAPPEFRTQPSY